MCTSATCLEAMVREKQANHMIKLIHEFCDIAATPWFQHKAIAQVNYYWYLFQEIIVIIFSNCGYL